MHILCMLLLLASALAMEEYSTLNVLTKLDETTLRVCLGKHTHPGTQLDRIAGDDCDEVIAIIRSGEKLNAKIHFSRDVKRGYQVPHIYRHRTCMVGIDFPHSSNVKITPEMEDDSTFEELALFVEAIVELCVEKRGAERVGGRVRFGDHGRITVAVQGTTLDEEDKGRDYYMCEPVRRPSGRLARPPGCQASVASSSAVSTPAGVQMQEHLQELSRLMNSVSLRFNVHPPVQIFPPPPPPPSGVRHPGSSKRSVSELSGVEMIPYRHRALIKT